MRTNACKRVLKHAFLTRVCAKIVRAFCVCIGRLSLTCTVYAKVEKCSSSLVQIKDSGLTRGVDDETVPFLAVKVSFRVHSKM